MSFKDYIVKSEPLNLLVNFCRLVKQQFVLLLDGFGCSIPFEQYHPVDGVLPLQFCYAIKEYAQ